MHRLHNEAIPIDHARVVTAFHAFYVHLMQQLLVIGEERRCLALIHSQRLAQALEYVVQGASAAGERLDGAAGVWHVRLVDFEALFWNDIFIT